MDPDKSQKKYTTLLIPVVVVNGIVSGIVSVITAYFFRPLWNKLMEWWHNGSD